MGTEAELATFKSPHDVVFESSRLRLRPIYPPTDIHLIHRMRRNPNAMKHMTTGVETEEDPFKSATYDRMKLMTAPGSFSFAIELKPSDDGHSGETIGTIGLYRAVRLGYLIDEPYWGKGYGTEVVRSFAQKYWEYFPEGAPGLLPEDRNVLFAAVFEGNLASENVLKKVGFREFAKEVVELPSGSTTQATVFMLERPEKVPLPAEVAGLPT